MKAIANVGRLTMQIPNSNSRGTGQGQRLPGTRASGGGVGCHALYRDNALVLRQALILG